MIMYRQVSFYLKNSYPKLKFQTSNRRSEEYRIGGGICMTLLARDYKDPKCVQIADLHYYNMDMPNRIYSPEGISPTLKTVSGGGEVKVLKNKLYRKLTPKEYFRLMGFSDSDYQILVDNGISKSQLYKMAGNSIVVTVLENLFKQIYKPVTQSIASLKQQSLDILNNI
jgi:DNA (cytosine-5)-methyltransferase 1